jgi:hypothetical protein
MIINLTYYTPEGAKSVQHRADSYDEGMSQVWPQVFANLGREGWELVGIETGAFYFKRRLQDGTV